MVLWGAQNYCAFLDLSFSFQVNVDLNLCTFIGLLLSLFLLIISGWSVRITMSWQKIWLTRRAIKIRSLLMVKWWFLALHNHYRIEMSSCRICLKCRSLSCKFTFSTIASLLTTCSHHYVQTIPDVPHRVSTRFVSQRHGLL